MVRGGYIDVPQGPGLGIELDEDALAERISEEDWRAPELTAPDDGSVVDW
ncbi:MAG: hypothetical protein A4E28_00349 [Methanocella sp. PtaU1.Bin125]|nr:MAG: hypothetical protein A4E28_00349 [Methanocella sp. PtaU1.Bin125]